MAEFKATQLIPQAKAAKTPDAVYWRSFKNPILTNHLASINHISSNAAHFAVSTNARLIIYKNNEIKRTISRFKDTVYTSDFRADGKIIAAGDATGLIQLFDVESRSILRSLRGHQSSARVVKFATNQTIFSGSDDKTVKHWDIPTEMCLATLTAHSDYIRAGTASQENPHLFISGSYDHTIKIWDSRTNTTTMTFNHGLPVESLVALPGGGLFASSGGNQIKIWDVLGNACIQTISNHQKTVTSLCLDGRGTRLLSGSLDHHVKVYSMEDFKVVHSVKYPAPVLAVAVTGDDKRLIVGMSNGLVSIRQRRVKTQDVIADKEKREIIRGGSLKHFARGSNYRPDNADIWVESKKQKVLKKYDRLLKKFQYSTALDSVLHKNQPPEVVISLIQELIHRDALKVSLANRDDISLEPIAQFIKRHITHPKFASILIDVTNLILDMYSIVINQSPIIDELFARITEKIKSELVLHQRMQNVLGIMDCLFNASIVTLKPDV